MKTPEGRLSPGAGFQRFVQNWWRGARQELSFTFTDEVSNPGVADPFTKKHQSAGGYKVTERGDSK